MTREEFLKHLIVKKFGNVKSFSEYIDIPYTTIRSILERGIGKAGIDNVLKICKGLNINPDQLTEEFDYNEYIAKTLSTMYSLSDDRQKIVYKCAEEQLEEQQREKIVSMPKKREVDTLAAHSDDPNKVITEEEKEDLHRYLDSIDEKYDKKHNKYE